MSKPDDELDDFMHELGFYWDSYQSSWRNDGRKRFNRDYDDSLSMELAKQLLADRKKHKLQARDDEARLWYSQSFFAQDGAFSEFARGRIAELENGRAQSSRVASAILDRLTAKLQTYRARSINSSQASLLDALADDIEEEREKVRAVPTGVAPDHADAGPGFTHHDDVVCCPCPCRKGAE